MVVPLEWYYYPCWLWLADDDDDDDGGGTCVNDLAKVIKWKWNVEPTTSWLQVQYLGPDFRKILRLTYEKLMKKSDVGKT